MRAGRIAAAAILISAVVAGAGLYYLQVYHFYSEVPAGGVAMTLVPLGGTEGEAIEVLDMRAIDATSSPIRFRACFEVAGDPAILTATFESYPDAEPLTAPGWFDCFDAAAIGSALEDGRAQAFLGHREIATGVDRVVAVFDDGRAFAWHQLNETFAD